ncbi:replication initiation factor domain-containing protein [Streptococcus iniae]|uniref:replication initiation factor domain-containing protein n=1 Tax=Streptococcus iniae TaxID=1346 RepID=UPI000EF688BA|nr:replication initiation factor domain-containing protein [Streptococcus iniae]RLV31186.1 Cro/Cl family transcriptional regulator [Streptococcus iniae]
MDGRTLQKLRKELKVSQKQFAEIADMSLSTLKSYECGRREFSLEKFKEIKSKIGFNVYDQKSPLRVMVDYLRVTFMNVQNLKDFVQTYLYVPLKDFTDSETGLLNYNHLYRRGDIWIFDFLDKEERNNYQISIQLSGQGCRQMELILEKHNLDWRQFLEKMLYERGDMQVTRLDIALDEMYRGFDQESSHFYLSDLMSQVYKKQVIFEHLKVWNHVGGGSLSLDATDDDRQGISLYFGSRQSNMFFNFYEKRYEYAKKEKISVEEALETFGVWNRYEIRLAQEKAHGLVEKFIDGSELGELARGLVNNEMTVYNGIGQYGAYIPDQKWEDMFGSAEPLQLSVKPEPYSIDRTIRWLLFQVSNSLAYVEEADRIMDTEYLKMIQNSGKPTDKMEKELKFLKKNYQMMAAS